MAFIEANDYKVRIRDKHLQSIIQQDSTILSTAESTAIAVVKDALIGNYNLEEIFVEPSEGRPDQVVRWVLSLVMYFIYERVPDAATPKRIVKNYDDTLMLLESIADGKRSLDLPRKLEEDGSPSTNFMWGGEERRI